MVWPTLGSRTAEEQNRTERILLEPRARTKDCVQQSPATVSRRRDNSLYDYAGRQARSGVACRSVHSTRCQLGLERGNNKTELDTGLHPNSS